MSIKHRSVFKTGSVEDANRAVRTALDGGVADEDVYIVARPDIEVGRVANRRKMADSDFIPSSMRGVLMGAGIGLVVGIVLMLTWRSSIAVLLIPMGIVAAMGGLAGSLAGAAIRDPVRRHFRSELESGSVLVVVDAEPEAMPRVQQALEGVGATRMAYDQASAAT